MALSDIVTISISIESAQIERAGFGMPLILAADCPAGFTERVRFYTDMTGVVVDFASTTATYKQAAKFFSQDPKPVRLAVGRLALKPTQRWALTPVAADSTVYAMDINGNTVSITSDSSATVTEIIAALKTAIDALSLAVTVSDQTTYMRIVANVAGAFFSVESKNTARMTVEQDHADPGYATDLAAIALEDSTWYVIQNPFNSAACVSAIAAWTESNKKFFVAQSQDTAVSTTSNSSDTGGSITIAGTLKAASYYRTALIYSTGTNDFADAAWDGKCLPLDPGSETWANKTLATVTARKITATQRTNLVAKRVNFYETIAGVNVTMQGKVSANEYIDVIRFRDWLEANMAADTATAIFNAKKIPFTDAGISVIQGIIKARLALGVAAGGLSSSPAPKVTVPLASAVSSSDKAARTLTGVKFDAVLAGAIHATTIAGVVTV